MDISRGKCGDDFDLSVFELISQLCKNVVRKEYSSTLTLKDEARLVKSSRSVMYGILLGKTHTKDVTKYIMENNYMDPISSLISERHILTCNGSIKQASELNEAINQMMKVQEHYNMLPVLKCLITLANSTPPASQNSWSTYYLHNFAKPEVMTCGVRPYPLFLPEAFLPPPWMAVSHSLSRFGGYISTFPFNKDLGECDMSLDKLCAHSDRRRTDQKHQLPLYKLRKVDVLTEPKELSLPLFVLASQQDDEGYVTPVTDLALTDHPHMPDEKDPTQLWSDSLQIKLPQVYSWETLGMLVSQPEDPFMSAATSDALAHLSSVANLYEGIKSGNLSEFLIKENNVSRGVFMRDALYLLVGVESQNFLYVEEEDCFVIRDGLCLEEYSVQTTKSLCEAFLFCGTHFRRLEKFSNCESVQLENGLVVQALKESVWRWTRFYYGVVLVLSSQTSSVSLFELLEKVKILKLQAECLAHLSHVVGPKKSTDPLPSGIALLANVYQKASMSSPQLSHLLYSVLRSCCTVYLRCLEQWIFYGSCSNGEHEEFFVHSDENFCNQRNRLYWTRGFVLNKHAVPDFLKGLENAIFDCGRAINLLLLCNPQHPLCFLLKNKHPTLRCCLYKTDLEMVQKDCAKFEFEVLQRCGEPFSVLNLFEEDKKREADLHQLILKVQEERALAQASLREQQMKNLAEKKRKQHAELKAQVEAAEQRKADQQKQQQLEDEKYLQECRRVDKALQQQEEIKREKLLAYYGSLNEIIGKKEKMAEWHMKRLKLNEKRQAFIRMADTQEHGEYKAILEGHQYIISENASLSVKNDLTSFQPEIIHSNCSPSTVGNSSHSQSLQPSVFSSDKKECMELSTSSSEPTWKINRKKVLGTELDLFSQLPSNNSQLTSIANKTQEEEKAQTLSVNECCSDIEEPVWKKNRRRILGTEFGIVDKLSIKDSSVQKDKYEEKKSVLQSSLKRVEVEEPEWKRNRRRVLGFELNMLHVENPSDYVTRNHCGEVDKVTQESELERNRRKVLGEEYDIITGEDKRKVFKLEENEMTRDKTISEDTGGNGNQSECGQENTSHSPVRPCDLPLTSQPLISSAAPIGTPSTTPHSVTDLPVFQSPFEGTNCFPHELILSSPLKTENVLLGQVSTPGENFPIMVDIMDRFSLKLDLPINDDDMKSETVSTSGAASETVNAAPNTAWLESSLQKCLLLPLHVQHRFVSAALLHYFIVDLKLLSHFKSLRSYYFMLDGEFGQYLTVKLFATMYQVKTPSGLLNSVTLNNLLRAALASSQGAADPNRSHLNLSAVTIPHHFSHYSPSVLDCLQLHYFVPWPLNLLLTEEAIRKYNVVFLFLLRLRRVAWLLQEDFIALKKTAHSCLRGDNGDLINSPQYQQVQMMRHAMSQFVQATLNYVSSSVLHASWADFEASLKKSKTIDHLYTAHIAYVKQLLKRCLLNNKSKRVEAVLSKVLSSVLQFHSQLRVRPWQLPNKYHANQKSCSVHLEHPNFKSLLSCFKHFKFQVCRLLTYLERLVAPPNPQQHLSDFMLLLNINGFYQTSEYLQLAEISTA